MNEQEALSLTAPRSCSPLSLGGFRCMKTPFSRKPASPRSTYVGLLTQERPLLRIEPDGRAPESGDEAMSKEMKLSQT